MLCFDIETVAACDTETAQVKRLALRREQEPAAFCALFPPLAKVVAVGMRDGKSGKGMVYVVSPGEVANLHDFEAVTCSHEVELLQRVAVIMAKVTSLLTFNGRSYDVPTLIHRMTINGVPVPPVLTKAANQKPWENAVHIDLMNALSFGGAFGRYPLEAFALAYQLPNPKERVDGSGVGELVRNGKSLELAEYCMADVDTTLALWRKWSGGNG